MNILGKPISYEACNSSGFSSLPCLNPEVPIGLRRAQAEAATVRIFGFIFQSSYGGGF